MPDTTTIASDRVKPITLTDLNRMPIGGNLGNVAGTATVPFGLERDEEAERAEAERESDQK